MHVDPDLAADPAVRGLAPERVPGRPVRSDQPPHHLPGPGQPLGAAPGGRQHREDLRAQHEARQAALLEEEQQSVSSPEWTLCLNVNS